jgi:hypothetical protein
MQQATEDLMADQSTTAVTTETTTTGTTASCLVLDVRGVDVEAVARDLLDTDAVTANDAETLHPDHYLVHAENVPYLVGTVLSLCTDAPRLASRPEVDDLLLALASFKDRMEEFVAEAESGAETWGTCSGEWARLERLRDLVDGAPSTSGVAALLA